MLTEVFTLDIQTAKEEEFISINNRIQTIINKSGLKDGICIIFCPHTTAALTINENTDPNVVNDLLYGYAKIYPQHAKCNHFEGNSHAHLKASTLGASETVIIKNGLLLLGTWQDIYLCEFDGPRNRKVYVKIIEG